MFSNMLKHQLHSLHNRNVQYSRRIMVCDVQHYLFNMIDSSNLSSPGIQIIVSVKLPVSCDDYLQVYVI